MQDFVNEQHAGNGTAAARPDPEVRKPMRRRFSAEYKLAILAEADACGSGEIGALLRREGLYSPYLSTWRRERAEGALAALAPRKRGRKGRGDTPEGARIAALEQTVRKLEREKSALGLKLKHADLLLEIQKKISELLGIPLSPPASDGSGS